MTYRQTRAARFCRPYDSLRLTVLSGLILTFAVLAIAEALTSPKRVFADFSGSEILFTGLAIVLFIVKIGRPQVYLDWLLFGVLHTGLGLSVLSPGYAATAFSSAAFTALLLASGAARIWVGFMAEPQAAGGWIISSGCIGLLGGAAVAIGQSCKLPIAPLSIAAWDLLLLGIAVAGCALTLHERKQCCDQHSRLKP